jgi:hypothetical protein
MSSVASGSSEDPKEWENIHSSIKMAKDLVEEVQQISANSVFTARSLADFEKTLGNSIQALRESAIGVEEKLAAQSSLEHKDSNIHIKHFSQAMEISLDSVRSLHESINSLKKELTDSRKSEQFHTNLQQLSWAINNAALNEFEYYMINNPQRLSSSKLVTNVLLNFRQSAGAMFKKNVFSVYPTFSSTVSIIEGEMIFFDKLCNQVHQLTGSRPKLKDSVDGWVVFQSVA